MILISVMTVLVTVIIAIFTLILNMCSSSISPSPRMDKQGGDIPPMHVTQQVQQEPMRGEIEKLIAMRDVPPITRVSDIPASPLSYQTLRYLRRAIHVGQFKLQLSEIQFLTECLAELPKDKPVYVVYAGSGPGHSRQNLADMFPNMKFVLIDPQEHVIKGCAGCFGPRMHEPRSKLYFRKSHGTSIGDEIIDFATKDEGIINCPKDEDIADARFLDANEIADVILREKSYTFYIIEDLFDDTLALAFKRLGTVLFISDIRTNINNPSMKKPKKHKMAAIFNDSEQTSEESPSDMDIIVNNIWQHTWVHIMQPFRCMLKFRTPFMNKYDLQMVRDHSGEFIDTIKRYNTTFNIDVLREYEEGRYIFMANDHINLQAFAGPSSSETRLIAGQKQYDKLVIYDPRDFENKLYYYNLMREVCFYERNEPYFDANIGLDGCADCDLALRIISEYISTCNKHGISVAFERPDEFIKNSLARMSRTLRSEFHGNVSGPFRDIADFVKTIEARSTRAKMMQVRHKTYLRKK